MRTVRDLALALLALAIPAFGACSSSGDARPTEGATAAPSAAPTTAAPGGVASAFGLARRALFRREMEVALPACSEDGVCLGGADAGPAPTERRTLGARGSPLLFGDDVRFLLFEEGRMMEALSALDAAIAASPAADALARLLLQNDLWERFDALRHVELESPHAAAAAALRRRLATTLRALALSPEAARALPSNLRDAATDHPAELGRIDEPDAWLEVRAVYRDGPPGAPLRTGARHDVRADHRMAFRVLARVPEEAGGNAWLRGTLGGERAQLPPGTRLALLATLLALTSDGDVVPTQVVAVAETRGVSAPPFPRFLDRPFDIFEGDAEAAGEGGPRLRRMPPDELIPMGASCAPTVGTLVPMRSACLLCHAQVGERITGPMAHGDTTLEEETDPGAAARRVAAEKRASRSLAELRALWATP